MSKIAALRIFVAMSVLAGGTNVLASTSAGITYMGRLLDSVGNPVTANTVQFKLQIRTPTPTNCLMYEETKTIDMSSSAGVFTLTINDGTGTRTDSSSYTLQQIFANTGSFTFAAASCGGANVYSPGATDGRQMAVSFNDGSFAGWEAMPTVAINYVPMSIEAYQVGGFTSASLLRVADASGNPQSASALTPANFTELLALINGTSTKYMASSSAGAALPVFSSTPSGITAGDVWFDSGTHQVKYFDGTSTQTVGTSGGSVTSVATGTGLTGGTITTTGTISLATIGSGGSGATKIDYDAYGRVTGSSALSGSDITSGTIGGTTAISTSGNIQTTQDMTARRYFLYDHSGAGPNSVGLQAPATVGTSYTLIFPASQGANGQVLTNDGLGNLSWAAASAGSVTSVTSANTDIGVATGTSTPVLTLNSGTGANQIVKLDGSSRLPAVDGSQVTNLNPASLSAAVPTSKGGTGLGTVGTANQVLGMNAGATGLEYKTITAGSGVSISNSAGAVTITATGSGGTVTSVTGTAPVTVATGTTTPAISIAKATSSVDGYLAATDFATFASKLDGSSAFAGDVTGTSSTTSVDKIKGKAVTYTSIASGQYLKYNGTGWVNVTPSSADLSDAGSLLKSSQMPASCSASQTLTFSSPTGTWVCSTISVATSAITGILPIANGGTNLSTVPTNGQLLIGNGTGYALGTLTAGSGVSIANSAGGITITATGSGGSVTNVTATAPITVATGTTTPALAIAKATSSVDGYLAATDFATFASKLDSTSAFAGDVSGTSAATSVDKIKGKAVTYTSIASGQFLRYDGTGWVNSGIAAGDISSGTFAAARMPAFTGDVTSTAGSTALTLATVPVAKGGTGLTTAPANGQVLIGNGTGYALGTLTAGTGVTIANSAGGITINATGSGGSVTNVSSANTDIGVASASTTPVLTLNTGTSANQIVKLDGSAKLPAVDGSALTNVNSTKLGGTAVTITSLTSGNYLKYNGTAWVNTTPSSADLSDASSLIKSSQMPANCSAGQTLTFSSPTGTWACSNITVTTSNFGSQAANTILAAPNGSAGTPTFRALVAADLPAGMLTGAGTANTVPYYATASTLAASPISVSGSNVGIGTSSPSAPFQIGSATASTSSSTGALVVTGGVGIGGNVFTSGTLTTTDAITSQYGAISGKNIVAGSGASVASFATDSSKAMTFSPDGSERMRIAVGGNVGIGTQSPQYPLEVNGQMQGANLRAAGQTFQPFGWSSYTAGSWQKIATIQMPAQYDAISFRLDVSAAGTWWVGGSAELAMVVKRQYSNSPYYSFVMLNSISPLNADDFGYVEAADHASSDLYMRVKIDGDAYQIQPRNLATVGTGALVMVTNAPSLASAPTGLVYPMVSGFSYNWAGDGWWSPGTDPNPNGGLWTSSNIMTSGSVGVGTNAPVAKLHVAGAIVSTPVDVASGTNVDLSQSNTITLDSLGGSVINLSNMVHGGNYTLVITDTTSRTYTFNGCTNTYFHPANAATTAGTQSIYTILTVQSGSNWKCYVSWAGGYQ